MKFLKPLPFLKKVLHYKIIKILLILILFFIISLFIFGIIFINKCSSAQPHFIPINEPATPEMLQVKSETKMYQRHEETTYLTFPEWYLVFNPQEYGQYLKTNLPSGFPYFASINQFWSGYCQVYGITKSHYEFNTGDHVVEVVIGSSFTVEYVVKGLYENTIGRISELTARGQQTSEDRYAAQVAVDYGNFIPTDPWYAFPFGEKFKGLWSETSLWGPHMVRKTERKFFLSLEYGVKFLYAKLIGIGTHATYGIAPTDIYAHVANAPASIFIIPHVTKIRELSDHSFIISVPHYQGFTDTAPQLADQGLQFIDVAGNDEILLTVITPTDWIYNLKNVSGTSELFSQQLLTDKSKKRVAFQVPIKFLSDALIQFKSENIQVEHLFDY